MEYASVKVYRNTLRKAKKLKGRLMQEEGEATDAEVFDRALDLAQRHESEFLRESKSNWEELKKFAGSWKLSEKEAESLIKDVMEMRKSWRRFA